MRIRPAKARFLPSPARWPLPMVPKGIRANTLCPGVIDTEMIHDTLIDKSEVSALLARNTPLQRNGTPEDVAAVALFLASEQSRFVTGETFAVDGGIIQHLGLA